jgi:cobalamin synthase
VSACFGRYCRHRIGGITGDTLGANVQLCECAALVAFLWTGAR